MQKVGLILKTLAVAIVGAMVLGGCQVNPMASAPVAIAPTGLTNIAQVEVPGTNVFFRPTTRPPVPACAMFPSASFAYSYGLPKSTVYSNPSPSFPEGTPGAGAGIVYLGSNLCPGGNCINTPNYRGVGGPNGDFTNDYFLRYRGHKGPDPSLDYNSLQLKFSASGATEHDMSGYQGFAFWARGHGNFSVNIVARMPIDGIAPTVIAGAPYSGWNFYLKRFGKELNGDTEWKQISVRFSEMVQEYGLASDLPTVVKRMTGLQFDQQVPVTADFQLDLDYIYFF